MVGELALAELVDGEGVGGHGWRWTFQTFGLVRSAVWFSAIEICEMKSKVGGLVEPFAFGVDPWRPGASGKVRCS